jgi:DNA-binding HxlR family transcriptional regulator
MGKTYGQYCALARALDVVGDRWTLLIVRQLLVGPATYGQLAAGLPGIATNLLAQRLHHLVDHGVVRRPSATGEGMVGGGGQRYELTPRGSELEHVVQALIRWGAPEMTRGAAGDVFRPEWLAIALRTIVRPGIGDGVLGFVVDDETVTVDLASGAVAVGPTGPPPDVAIHADPEIALGLSWNAVALSDAVARGRAEVRGGTRAARRLLSSLHAAAKAAADVTPEG